ncbi:hypothetical protein DHEL01_v213047 [Diaporthe helianthi]|uniref:Uncharacterized protein n=1 Tax=Diaporthe helianthi TaxID=158607 RepID=A0A2P5HEA0_DIAHE|nr:hypothetical protein DHEL01_v213047 [Diaporthe helianthi]
MGRFRAVCTLDEQWASAFISGVGERHQFHDLVPNPLRNGVDGAVDSEQGVILASDLSGIIEENIKGENMEIDICSSQFGANFAVGPGPPIWGFPFHCSCWDVLNAYRETQREARHEIQALFDVLRSFPRQKLVDFGHNYGDVAGYDLEVDWFDVIDPSHEPFGLLPGEEYRLVYDRSDRALLEVQKHDPMQVFELFPVFTVETPAGSSALQAYPVDIRNDYPVGYSDPFGKLPVELLHVSQFPTPPGALASYLVENSTCEIPLA